MSQNTRTHKRREWIRRYLPAEIAGTICALLASSVTFYYTHSYAAGAAIGWVSEGIGFFGYFITAELTKSSKQFMSYPLLKRLWLTTSTASTNLFVEFLPAEIVDNFLVRPAAMYLIPHYIHPYVVGFFIAKLSADSVFYLFAILGYETRKHWLNRHQ